MVGQSRRHRGGMDSGAWRPRRAFILVFERGLIAVLFDGPPVACNVGRIEVLADF
jgi:hypothetical protein